MIQITENNYLAIKNALIKALKDKIYFSGSININLSEKYICRLFGCFIAYNNDKPNIVPVWYELAIYIDNVKTENDFSFSELKKYF